MCLGYLHVGCSGHAYLEAAYTSVEVMMIQLKLTEVLSSATLNNCLVRAVLSLSMNKAPGQYAMFT